MSTNSMCRYMPGTCMTANEEDRTLQLCVHCMFNCVKAEITMIHDSEETDLLRTGVVIGRVRLMLMALETVLKEVGIIKEEHVDIPVVTTATPKKDIPFVSD